MYIKSIHLKNFQKHVDLQIDFCNGVNVLYGVSGVGKSCIKHAIEFLCEHDSFKGQRKVGTKTTSVKGWFSNGVIVERIISNSINRYILNEDDDNPFNSVGKKAPDEIKEAIGICPINVDGEEIFLNSQSQIALPFLFDKSPSFRMKLFNKLTGNDVLDKLFTQFNKDILHIKRDIREETERYEKNETELKSKKIQKEKTEIIHARLKIRVEKVKCLHLKYAKLLELKKSLEKTEIELKESEAAIEKLKFIEDIETKQLKENIERFEQLRTLKNASEKAQVGLDRVNGQLKGLSPLSFDLTSLKGKIDRFGKIEAIYEKFSQIRGLFSKNEQNSKITVKELEKAIERYKALLADVGICPTCKGKITDACLRDIK